MERKELIDFHDWCVDNVTLEHKNETTEQRVKRYFKSTKIPKIRPRVRNHGKVNVKKTIGIILTILLVLAYTIVMTYLGGIKMVLIVYGIFFCLVLLIKLISWLLES